MLTCQSCAAQDSSSTNKVHVCTAVTADTAVQLRRTCVHLLGSASTFYRDLSDWLGKHPDYIPSAFEFLCQMIRVRLLP